MKLKLDENLGARGADLLRKAGHDVATVPEQQLSSAADVVVANVCRSEGRCLVTLDLDFSNPIRFKPEEYAGIAVLRLPSKPAPRDLVDLVLALISALAQSDITGKLWIVKRGRIRVYTPEGGRALARGGPAGFSTAETHTFVSTIARIKPTSGALPRPPGRLR